MQIYNDSFVEVLDILKNKMDVDIGKKLDNIDLNEENLITYNGNKVYVYLDDTTIKFSTVERSDTP